MERLSWRATVPPSDGLPLPLLVLPPYVEYVVADSRLRTISTCTSGIAAGAVVEEREVAGHARRLE